MADTRIYDADRVVLSFAGRLINSGYADGEFCAIDDDSDAFTIKVGTDGEVTRSKTNNASAKITISLMQSSKSNDFLSEMLRRDKSTPGGAGIGIFEIRDLQGNSLEHADAAWIVKNPPRKWARDSDSRVWALQTGSIDTFVGSNIQVG